MPQQYTDPYNTNTDGRPYFYQNDSYDYNYPARNGGGQGYGVGDPYDGYTNNVNNPYPPIDNGAGLERSRTRKVTYAQGEDANAPSRRRTKKKGVPDLSVAPLRKQWNGFEHGEFTPTTGTSRSKRNLKAYRLDTQGNLWTKGGGARSFGRFLCCTIMVTLLIVVSVVLSLVLFVRPPSIIIGDVVARNTTGSLSAPDGLAINLSVNISVNNPNYFSVDFHQLKVEIFYPMEGRPDTPVGGGESRDIVFKARERTDVEFPFALRYRAADDPGQAVFVDIGGRCGVGGGQRQNLNIKYKLTLGIRFLMIPITPVVENRFSFACPESLLENANTAINPINA
ncbi:hypothetical protein FA15DRAFT_663486 [Coprinopsis marcescibilis]|uniref:Late embryogenesis abundant protein LEA-2 subgroup domain-containing protein n=1 Tax=Coprinopsis marcescibilis TaxID=230819 RepID=A0A5C3LCF4_COPMA|nr:hypothetical protein FA15DRAFT_663486 [Coprinopsis marcescibilis]